MLKLFHAPDSRSSRFIWLLEELGADYELVYCAIKRRSGIGTRDPSNPHPEGRVPALLHGNRLVTEQLGIALYLLELFPDSELGVPPGSDERGAFLSWLGFWASEADPAYNARMFYADRLDPTTERDSARVTARVANTLSRSPYLMGHRFTAVDLFTSGPFEWDPELADQKRDDCGLACSPGDADSSTTRGCAGSACRCLTSRPG
ncbi:glutathione S-transferase family protein [Bradyrhizobium sp. USDA 4473]